MGSRNERAARLAWFPPLRLQAASSDGRPVICNIHGGAAEQLRALARLPDLGGGQGSMLQQALAGVPRGRQQLVVALGHPSQERRVWESQLLLEQLWRADGGLGPYPLLQKLAHYQAAGVYWRRYRDHLVHQLRVWVLGLYLLGRVEPLWRGLLDEVRREVAAEERHEAGLAAEALRRWKVAALWHDLGYVFEVQDRREALDLVEETLADLYELLYTPLTGVLEGSPGALSDGLEERWRNLCDEHPLPTWPRLRRFDALVQGPHRRHWEQLGPAAVEAGLASAGDTDGLRRYFEIVRRGDLADRQRHGFVDHGLAGALLLLRQHRFVHIYTQRVQQLLRDQPELCPDAAQQDALEAAACSTDSARETVLAAARAVALHNLRRDTPDARTASVEGLSPAAFALDVRRQALAHLLALADGLQDWDRPRYSEARSGADHVPIDQDIWVTAGDRRIHVDFPTEADEARAGRRFDELRGELAACLAGLAPGGLLAWGVTPAEPAPRLAGEITDAPGGAGAPPLNLAPYNAFLERSFAMLKMPGITGAVKMLPLQKVYVRLRLRPRGVDAARRPGPGQRDDLDLSEVLDRPLLALVGAPGSGKTTILLAPTSPGAHMVSPGRPRSRAPSRHRPIQTILYSGNPQV